MSTVIHLSFDIPPSVNKLYRRSGSNVVLTEEALVYRQMTILQAREQYKDEPLEGALCVTLHFYGSRLDIDNGTKILADSIQGIVYLNDAQIIELHIYKCPDDGDKRVEMEVRQL